MTRSYLLDTNAVSDLAKIGDAKQKIILNRLADEIEAGSLLCISSVTLFEIEHGVLMARDKLSKALLHSIAATVEVFSVRSFDKKAALEAANVAAELSRKGQKISIMDALIAGHARHLGFICVTHNLREFGRVSKLQVEDWTS